MGSSALRYPVGPEGGQNGRMMARKTNRQNAETHEYDDTAKAIRQLEADIRTARSAGRVLFSIKERRLDGTETLSPQAVADELVSRLGGKRLGYHWVAIPHHDARVIARRILVKDLAYSSTIMTDDHALALTERFFAYFRGDNWYATNAALLGRRGKTPITVESFDRSWCWNSLTDATFDLGIVIVNTMMMGILCAADED
jgi:hypothetical protein